jgi:predicted amidohydrolase YtcJ
MQDGIVENYTAGLLAPYLDRCGHPTDNTGLSMVDPLLMKEYVARLDALGFQVHVHAIGDRAVRETLDAFETAVQRNGRNDNRHHVAHIQMISREDVPRFRDLGVVANMQPLWATNEEQMTDLTLPFLDSSTAASQYPFRDLARSGARLAAGSDWPVSSPNPLWAIHVAVNRQLPREAGEVCEAFMPEQALDVHTALRAYTSGSAYVNHLDDSGVVREGARADLAILDRDILSGPIDEIGAARVVATYVDGTEVYPR